MLDAGGPIPQTSPSLLQADAPSLLSLHSAHPDISIITPSSPDYSTVHQEYNTCITTVPLAIVFPSNVAQLAAAVKYCASQTPPVPMTVRGGGHDAYGRNILAGAVQLDLRLMKWTKISPPEPGSLHGTATATIGPGTTAIEMQRVLAAAGLAAPTGWVGTVGVTGWACGGGYGLEAGMWGLGVDNIVGAKLLTPRGDLVDTDDDPELLWAVRGAGLGNFGVICELRLQTYPNPRYLAGYLAFPLAEGEKVMGGFQRMSDDEGLPRNFSAELTVNTMQLGPTVNFLFAWTCEKDEDVAAGWAYLEKLKALGTVVLNTVAESKMDSPPSRHIRVLHEYII
jgi:FAD/FMN-containing dehydrogenase